MEDGLKKIVNAYWLLFLIAGLIVVADQITKELVRQNLAVGQTWAPWEWIEPYARFIHWHNTGVAFGMFQGMGIVFAVLAAVVSVGLVYYYPRLHQNNWIIKLAMSMMLGGALGNLVDRITLGYVTDFISVGTFAVFNVADSSITVGTIVLVLGVYLLEQKQKQEKKPESNPNSEPDTSNEAES